MVEGKVVFGVDANVIHINFQPFFHYHISEDVVHKGLECGWCIAKPRSFRGCALLGDLGGDGNLINGLVLLRFYSWVVLFSSFLPFMPHLLSQGPFPLPTIIIFLSWDPSHSPYAPSNPYAVPYTTTGQGTLFTYLFLVMDDYSFSRFSCICCVLLLLILLSMMFHDIPFLLSGTFYLVPSCSFAYSADLLSSI